MSDKYTQVDEKVWAEKERRIVKQSCLTRATDIAIALWTHSSIKSLELNPEQLKNESAKLICELANVFVAWVYNENKTDEKPPQQETVENIPIPTLLQKEVLEQIADETGFDYEFVLNEIWKKKNSLIVTDTEKAKIYIRSLEK